MSNVLPALRRALDILPSPEADRPGLLLRDPLHMGENMKCINSILMIENRVIFAHRLGKTPFIALPAGVKGPSRKITRFC